MKCRPLLGLVLVAHILPWQVIAAESVDLSINATKNDARIDRNIFGQFPENSGHGLYEGIWGRPRGVPVPEIQKKYAKEA
jgi:alpha-N-arabinofuranosidase